MGKFADYAAELDAAPAKAPGKFARYAAELDAPPADPTQGGNMPAMFDVKANLQDLLSNPAPPPVLPGNTPRLSSPADPNRREIALDASRASAANAETPEAKATREYNGFLAGTQQMVPFFPRVRGAVAGAVEETKAAVNALAGNERENTEFARMQAAYLERKNAQRQIEGAAKAAPVQAVMGNVAAGALTPIAGPARLAGKVGAAARLFDSAVIGGTYGASAADRPGVTDAELLTGFGVGAGIGAVAGAVGEGTRGVVRSASAREDKSFMREITRTEGGDGSMGILAKNKEGILRDYKNIVALRRDPELRAAASMPEGKGAEVFDAKIRPYAEAQGPRYEQITAKVADDPAKRMTGVTLWTKLEEAKGKVSSEASQAISHLQDDLQKHWLGNVWQKSDSAVIPAQDFRNWLSAAQKTAANTPGALNWTNSYAAKSEASKAAKQIFNDYLDGAGLPEVAEAIRRDNVPISTLSTVRDAIKAKGKKEALQSVGLGQVAQDQARGMERTAAIGAAATGHPELAAGILIKPYAEQATKGSLRWMNGVLDSMNLAAEHGATKAQLARFAIERGLPQGLANTAAERFAKTQAEKTRKAQDQTVKTVGKFGFLVPPVEAGQ